MRHAEITESDVLVEFSQRRDERSNVFELPRPAHDLAILADDARRHGLMVDEAFPVLEFVERCFFTGDEAVCMAALANGIEARGGRVAYKPMRDKDGKIFGAVVGELV